jgi:hypothetical protein
MAQGKINAQTGHLKKISALSKRSSGKIWLTDGSKNMMINPEEQIPEGFRRGKTQTKREEIAYSTPNAVAESLIN